MTTRIAVEGYFKSLADKTDWPSFLSEDMVFTSFTNPIKHVAGKAASLEATKRFYSMIASVEVRGTLVDGDRACALTRYQLRPPAGPALSSDVAEVFQVRDGKIVSFEIYFDNEPFPK